MEQVSDSQQKLEKKIQTEYKKAYAEIKKKFLADKKRLQKQDAEMKRKLDEGEIKREEYDKWRKGLEKKLNRDTQKMAIILNGADQLAVDMINEVVPKEYADGVNEETYHIEKDLNIDTNFTLVDEDAALNAVEGKFLADIDYKKNDRWNQRRISSAITQGIISGDSIPAIADRLLPLVNGNQASAMRNARTWTLAARSGGEQQAAERAVAKGVMIEKWWISVTDLRTRISHRRLYGEHKEVTEPFSNGGMYPRDPDLPPEERYNCRCNLRYLHKGLTPDFDGELKDLNGITLEEWKAGKDKERKRGVVNGEDISGTWKRRPDKFDFEIEDVINAQGFDGKPRVVDEDEFDKLVKESGFIAQRTYAAPDQKTLDMYRDELYKGKWYVDCSTGGAQYGQGMYCAADYTGVLSGGITVEMKHYQMLGASRLGDVPFDDLGEILLDKRKRQDEIARKIKSREIEPSKGVAMFNGLSDMLEYEYLARYMKKSNIAGARAYTETLTLDKSAKIIDYNELTRRRLVDFDTPNMDIGAYAALLGYDAINAGGHGQSGSYTVILNRTKVIFKRSR